MTPACVGDAFIAAFMVYRQNGFAMPVLLCYASKNVIYVTFYENKNRDYPSRLPRSLLAARHYCADGPN